MSDETTGTEVATAQATDVPVEVAPQQNDVAQGIQKRFDELTAKLYEERGKSQALEAALAQRVTAEAMRPTVQAPQVDEAEAAFSQVEQYNPELAAAVKRAFAAQKAATDASVRQIQVHLEQQAALQGVEQFAATAGVKDPKIVARSKELMVAMKQRGIPLNNEDAVKFAMGEAALAPKPARGNDGRYAPADALMTQAGSPAPVSTRSKSLPQNFNNLDAAQQFQLLDANGVGDLPL